MVRVKLMRFGFIAAGVMFWICSPGIVVAEKAADIKPKRIVSINICSDEILLRLADRSRIAGVTTSALVPKLSSVVDLAQGLKTTYGSAEEVLLLEPDLVIAGGFYTRETVNILKKLGINVKVIKNPKNYDEVREHIRDIAEAVGEKEKGEELIREMDMRLERVRLKGIKPVNAIFYWPSGMTVGTDTLISAIMESAGAHNIAGKINIKDNKILDHENLILTDPDMIIVSDYRREVPTVSRQFLSHPVIRKRFGDLKTVAIPLSTIFCGSPVNVEATEFLSRRIEEYHLSDKRQ